MMQHSMPDAGNTCGDGAGQLLVYGLAEGDNPSMAWLANSATWMMNAGAIEYGMRRLT